MIGLDTNVIVRYLAQDDPAQSRKATALIERRLTTQNPGFISVVAVVETASVLERSYGLRDTEVATAIESMLQTDVLVLEREQEVFTALVALKCRSRLFCGCAYRIARFERRLFRYTDV